MAECFERKTGGIAKGHPLLVRGRPAFDYPTTKKKGGGGRGGYIRGKKGGVTSARSLSLDMGGSEAWGKRCE